MNNKEALSIHPDDAKDKVFAAILKALIKMGNTPSSPKELANTIVKHKYATLGGQTPFATVSSRISQHFKRAAQHNPPRQPLLVKHVDQHHSRKINYSLTTDDNKKKNKAKVDSDSSEEKEVIVHEQTNVGSSSLSRSSNHTHEYKQHKDNDEEIAAAIAITRLSQPNHSEEEISDYYEDMMQDNTPLQKQGEKSSSLSAAVENEYWAPFSFEQEFDNVFLSSSAEQPLSNNKSPISTTADFDTNINTPPSSISPPPESRKPYQVITSTLKGHTFKITKKWINDMEFYELDSPDDIPNTKVLRFISCTQPDSLLKGYVNATQLRKAAMPVLGEGEFELEHEKKMNKIYVIVTKGSIEIRGTWVPLIRARELIEDFEIESSPGLTKLLSDNPLSDIKEEDSTSQASLDFSNQLTNTLMNEANNNPNSTNEKAVKNKESSAAEMFIKYEETEKKLPPPKVRKHAKIAPSTKHLSTSEILKSMNIQNLNLSALQHSPNFAHQQQQLSFARNLETYMQTLAKQPSTSSAPVQDLKNVLSRIPLFDALLNTKKVTQKPDSNTTTTTSSPSSSPNTMSPTSSFEQPLVIYPILPTEPPMSITLIDGIAVCIATLKKKDEHEQQKKEYQVMRRLDTGFINGTQLLIAGGIETESERSMILSFEMNRVRMPNKKSSLFGTWIPSRRAVELAATCSIQHALGPFMNDDIENLFPSPLPIHTKNRRRRSNSHHLAAITLAALKHPANEVSVAKRDSIDSSTSSSLNDQLLTHPNNTLKMAENTQQAPLLGRFLNTDGDRKTTVIDTSVVSHPPIVQEKKATNNDGDNNSDIDIEGEDSFMADLVCLDDEQSDEETDTDNDVEEVRKNMRKKRDAAIAAMEIGNSMELDDIFSSSQPKESKRRKKHNSKRKRKLKMKATSEDNMDSAEEEEEVENASQEMDAIKNHFIQSQHATPYKSFNYSRRRPSGITGGTGGKWSASSVGKLAPTAIKRSATWSGSMDSPIGRRQKAKAVDSLSISTPNSQTTTTSSAVVAPIVIKSSTKKKSAAPLVTHTVVNEEDEDEDVDIGGSDNDDDLR